jgi:hypothetical protein
VDFTVSLGLPLSASVLIAKLFELPNEAIALDAGLSAVLEGF